MSPQPTIQLTIGPDALPAVVFALQRTIDDLEARAIIAIDRDVELGPPSAAEYRADIGRLAGMLGQLGHPASRPVPERAAVVWCDGLYTVDDGQPVRLTPTSGLDRLLEQLVARRDERRLTPGALIELFADAIGAELVDVADRLVDARRARDADRRHEFAHVRGLSRDLAGPESSQR
jgi:hypothetical protein